MVTFPLIIPSLSQGAWFTALNMKDAYFHIDIHLVLWKFLFYGWSLPLSVPCPPLQYHHHSLGIHKSLCHCCSPHARPRPLRFPTWMTGSSLQCHITTSSQLSRHFMICFPICAFVSPKKNQSSYLPNRSSLLG